MTAQVQPYLIFAGRCDEAIEFYRRAVGAEVTALSRFGEAPHQGAPGMPPEGSDAVMHAALSVGETTFMLSDGMCPANGKYTREPAFRGFALTYVATTAEDAAARFAALAEGGAVEMPLDRTFFAERFGTLTDRFGVSWMVIQG